MYQRMFRECDMIIMWRRWNVSNFILCKLHSRRFQSNENILLNKTKDFRTYILRSLFKKMKGASFLNISIVNDLIETYNKKMMNV